MKTKTGTIRKLCLPAILLTFAAAVSLMPQTVFAEDTFYAPETAVFLDLNEDYSGSYGSFRVENVTPYAYVDASGIQSAASIFC